MDENANNPNEINNTVQNNGPIYPMNNSIPEPDLQKENAVSQSLESSQTLLNNTSAEEKPGPIAVAETAVAETAVAESSQPEISLISSADVLNLQQPAADSQRLEKPVKKWLATNKWLVISLITGVIMIVLAGFWGYRYGYSKSSGKVVIKKIAQKCPACPQVQTTTAVPCEAVTTAPSSSPSNTSASTKSTSTKKSTTPKKSTSQVVPVNPPAPPSD